jgi:hypothetical protein
VKLTKFEKENIMEFIQKILGELDYNAINIHDMFEADLRLSISPVSRCHIIKAIEKINESKDAKDSMAKNLLEKAIRGSKEISIKNRTKKYDRTKERKAEILLENFFKKCNPNNKIPFYANIQHFQNNDSRAYYIPNGIKTFFKKICTIFDYPVLPKNCSKCAFLWISGFSSDNHLCHKTETRLSTKEAKTGRLPNCPLDKKITA